MSAPNITSSLNTGSNVDFLQCPTEIRQLIYAQLDEGPALLMRLAIALFKSFGEKRNLL